MATLKEDGSRALRSLALFGVVIIGVAPLLALFIGTDLRAASAPQIRALTVVHRTMPLLLAGSVLATALGATLAALIVRIATRWQAIAFSVLSIPLALPAYIMAIAWSGLATAIGLPALRATGNFAGPSAALILIWAATWFPIAMWLIWSAARRTDRSAIEALWVSGRRFSLRILVYGYAPSIFLAWVLIFAGCLSDFAVPDYLRISTFATVVFAEVSGYYNLGGALALCAPWLVILVGLVAITMRLFSQVGRGNVEVKGQRSPAPFATAPLILAVFLLVLVPVGALMTRITNIDAWRSAGRMLAVDAIPTAVLALGAAALSAILGYALAHSERARDSHESTLVRSLLATLWLCPSAVLGLGAVALWNHKVVGFIYESGLALLFLLAAKSLWLSFEIPRAALQRISMRDDEAHYVSGRSVTTLMRWRLTRISGAPFVLAAIAAALIALADLSLTTLLAPPGLTTWSARIFSTVHYGASALVAALCALQVAVLLSLAMFATIAIGKRSRPRRA